MAPVNEELCANSAIADELFIEMCDRGPLIIPKDIEGEGVDDCPRNKQEVNIYYYRAAKYAGRISAGDFTGRKAKYRPIFELDFEDFSQELQQQLQASKDSLDLIVTEAVFKLFRARHKFIFFEHIQAKKLRWDFHGL
jgi:hypothetical protein